MTLPLVDEACRKLEEKLYQITEDPRAKQVSRILTEACRLVRERDLGDPELSTVVERVSETVNIGIDLAYRSLDIDYLPSFAHTREFPLLEAPNPFHNFINPQIHDTLLEGIDLIFGRWETHPLFILCLSLLNYFFTSRFPKAWGETPRPHPSSTRLSRFARQPTLLPSSSALVKAIYEARCEISSDEAFAQPLRLVNNGSCLVVPSMGGYKQRDPLLTYYVLGDTTEQHFPLTARHADVGLSEVAFACATDEQRKLIFLADDYRIKSYAWANQQTGEIYEEGLATHTLSSRNHTGAIAVLTSGSVIRASKGSAAMWNLDELPTHGRTGRKRIGRKFSQETWRDDEDEIEDSSGSQHTSVIKFADPKVAPAVWHPHPGLPATMLCTSNPAESEDYSFISLDLEHGGKTVVRYFGNGGGIGDFSTSKGDPNAFLTGASDGHARLYDTRMPLPVLTFCAGSGDEDCGGVALIHPDGIPAVFTGSTNDQVIRLWDIRARKMVYELSTGNNDVNAMTWDDAQNALYVSTTCSFMDRNGYTSDYRRARLPLSMLPEPVPRGGMPNYDDEGPFDKCWPKRAKHAEGYWGAVFDAGNHRILRYAFKEHADPSVLPGYGGTTLNTAPYY
ncbi:hypothetical protein C8R44DRAFT_873362 [Mycena epipterygia]|nr:hypothetical protein C8R44DRAFT_873362 [Mycena epipterygia]